jgi:hypothetical protein
MKLINFYFDINDFVKYLGLLHLRFHQRALPIHLRDGEGKKIVFYIVNQIFYPHGLAKVFILKLWSFTSQYYKKALCSGLNVFTKMISNKIVQHSNELVHNFV